VEAILVDGLDALGGQPQPHVSAPLIPVHLAPLEVQVLHLLMFQKHEHINIHTQGGGEREMAKE